MKNDNELLREKKLKTGVILKESLSESEDLKRELTLVNNNLDFCKQNEEQLKQDNYLLRSKLQKLERDNSQLNDQIEKINYEHEDSIAGLLTLERSLSNGLSDPSIIRSKLSSIINSLRMNSETCKLSNRIFSEMPNTERFYTEPVRERSMTEDKTTQGHRWR